MKEWDPNMYTPWGTARNRLAVYRNLARTMMVLAFGLSVALGGRPTLANDAALQNGATVHLKVKAMGLETNRGHVAFALFGSEEGYASMSNPVRGAFVEIRDRRCEWSVTNIAPGEYAVMLFHDRNANGKLDTLFRLPVEPYGFSNNARALTRAPYFRESKFVVHGDTIIEIIVK